MLRFIAEMLLSVSLFPLESSIQKYAGPSGRILVTTIVRTILRIMNIYEI